MFFTSSNFKMNSFVAASRTVLRRAIDAPFHLIAWFFFLFYDFIYQSIQRTISKTNGCNHLFFCLNALLCSLLPDKSRPPPPNHGRQPPNGQPNHPKQHQYCYHEHHHYRRECHRFRLCHHHLKTIAGLTHESRKSDNLESHQESPKNHQYFTKTTLEPSINFINSKHSSRQIFVHEISTTTRHSS